MVWLLDIGCFLAGLALIATECFIRLSASAVRHKLARMRAEVAQLEAAHHAVRNNPDDPAAVQELTGRVMSLKETVGGDPAAGIANLPFFDDLVKKNVFLVVGALLLLLPLLLQSGYHFTIGSGPSPAPGVSAGAG
jgi:hypothetical protein